MSKDDEFERLFDRFKAMLAPYAARMPVSADAPGLHSVDTGPEDQRKPATWFAATRLAKRYVMAGRAERAAAR